MFGISKHSLDTNIGRLTTTRASLAGSSAIALLVVLSLAAHAADEPKREMWEEPSHQLVFELGNIRILDIRIAPGATSEFHSHYLATVYIRIQDALMQNQDLGEAWDDKVDRAYGSPGSVIDAAGYVDRNTYHRVHNFDDRGFHLLSIVNAANPMADVEQVPDDAGKDLLNNSWFREHRLLLGPGETSGELVFENNAVLVQYDSGAAHVLEEGVSHSIRNVPGSWSWHPAHSSFRLVNGVDEPREFILIEVRE